MSNVSRDGSSFLRVDHGPERTCQACGRSYRRVRSSRYCSDACRQRAFRQRHARPLVRLRPPPGLDVLYECSECGERYLNQRRCDDCTRFCRRLGAAALCPNCDEPILLAELLSDFHMEETGPR